MTAPRFLIIADGDFEPDDVEDRQLRHPLPPRTHRRRCSTASRPGKTVQDVLGFGGGDSGRGLDARRAGARSPTAVLIGIAPKGGQLPGRVARLAGRGARRRLRPVERAAHLPRRRSDARGEGARPRAARCYDLRRPPADLPIASGLAKAVDPLVVLTVGTDCNVGKMTAQLQLTRKLNERGIRTRFVPTGQTGIMIEGWGIAVDAVVADFIAGAAERLTLEGSKNADVVLVEGQGSINHPGYSGVTLGPAARLLPRRDDPLPPEPAASTSATIARPPGSGSRRSPNTCGCTRPSARRCIRPGSSASRSTPTT